MIISINNCGISEQEANKLLRLTKAGIDFYNPL